MPDDAPLLVPLASRGRLRVSGEDRVRFLNGQFSNDLRALKSFEGCYGVFPDAKGRVRADAVVLNPGPCLLADLEPGAIEPLVTDLARFLIADDVLLEPLGDAWRGSALIGADAARALVEAGLSEVPPEPLFAMTPLSGGGWESGFAFRSRRATAPSFDLWWPAPSSAAIEARLEEAVRRLGGRRGDAAALEVLRVEAGIPRFDADFNRATLPQEAGLEEVAISFTKGCYIGQEVISRIKSVGHVNRVLARLRLPPSAKTGDPLRLGEREIGRLGSAVVSPRHGPIGLAIVRREAAAAGVRLSLPEGEARVVADFSAAP
ncbi:MAG: folate-binding protein YgfZ [Verrucomicrobiae bacterium]|nr:folate-binding protein YgfZ [Verrucomicrobiae bacterium]